MALETAKENILARYRALTLLTTWLGVETELNPQRIQAQRTVMKIFGEAKQQVCNQEALKTKGKAGIVKDLVKDESPNDTDHQKSILEELCGIFLIVDEICIDLRLQTSPPYDPENLILPVWASIDIPQP
jgi:hypothetical protein